MMYLSGVCVSLLTRGLIGREMTLELMALGEIGDAGIDG